MALEECPKWLVSAESVAFVEEFLLRQRMGFGEMRELSARQVEAFVILQGEMEREVTDAASEN